MLNGTIEGFFGDQWKSSDRLSHCKFLKQHGYSFYIYAPKSDHHLRKNWRQDWPNDKWHNLVQTAKYCKEINLDFGIGISPFELHLNFNRTSKIELTQKIARINQLNPDIICILFDDMRGDTPNLAETQAEIVDHIRQLTDKKKLIVCPSYYSEDQVLDKVFGKRPENYLTDLGRLLPPQIDIFWTGPKVCSRKYTNAEIKKITRTLSRKPFLWDNYPVNDGAKMCNHLNLEGFKNRDNLSEINIAGHAINPMNQPWLSQIPMSTLPMMYKPKERTKLRTTQAIDKLCCEKVAEAISKDLIIFQVVGLNGMSKEEVNLKIDDYKKLPSSPYTKEIISWLEGGYKFDPNCLT